jgi:hypothetical protein
MHQKLYHELHFDSYWSDVSLTLYEDQIDRKQISQTKNALRTNIL